MKNWMKLLPNLILMLSAWPALASDDVEMADVMRSNGKIYVVVAVFVVLLAGLVIYLISVERSIGRVEKKMKEIEESLTNK